MTEFKDYKNYGNEEKEDEAQYFCKFTFGQFFTIIVLEVVTLAFIFYLGAKYGTDYLKITADNGRTGVTEVVAGSQTAQSIPPELQDSELQALAKDVVSGGSDESLKEKVRNLLEKQKENAQIAGVVSSQEALQPATQPTQPVQPVEPSQPVVHEMNQASKATVAQTGNAAQPATQPVTQPTPPPTESGAIKIKASSNSQFSIQVGSYPNMNEATSRVDDWRNKGYAAFMMIADIPDRGRWYRVRIGGFSTKEDAQVYLDKFKQNESTEAIIVFNEQ